VTIFQKSLNFVDCVYQITFIHRVIPQVHIIAIRLTEYNHPDIIINTRLSCNRFRRVPQVMDCKAIFNFSAIDIPASLQPFCNPARMSETAIPLYRKTEPFLPRPGTGIRIVRRD
jgi:hypothetical protein